MKKITITTKNFKELNKEEKEKIIEKYRDINTNFDDWHQFIIDDWKLKTY